MDRGKTADNHATCADDGTQGVQALFSIRDACERDREAVDGFAFLEGMDALPSLDHVRVAVDDEDEVVAFCRLTFDSNGIAYVNPIVTYPTWRGFGVGSALIEDARERFGELRLIARGNVAGFYERLGFTDLSWEEADLSAASEDCENCPYRAECGPRPMRLP